MVFEITEDMEKTIRDWDSCRAVDVAGAKLIYKFIPTSIGLVIEVQCGKLQPMRFLFAWAHFLS